MEKKVGISKKENSHVQPFENCKDRWIITAFDFKDDHENKPLIEKVTNF